MAYMSYNPAQGFPRVMPSLRYEDVNAALTWLSRVFGLKEYLRWTDENGIVRFASMRIDNAFIEMMAASESYQSPKRLGGVSHALVVLVDDVDAHYQRARALGAAIIAEPEDKPWGLRQYMVEDLEGHHWEFSQFLRDVPPDEWGAQLME
jgi:uncharacterized glyoxalase superfamily protein PhnB